MEERPPVPRQARPLGAESTVRETLELARSRSTWRLPPWLRVLRPQQWVKNVLVLVPLAAAHELGNLALLARVGFAFAAFSLCAAGLYVVNDLLDVEADRRHPANCRRPLAAGELGVPVAVVTGIGSWLGSALI